MVSPAGAVAAYPITRQGTVTHAARLRSGFIGAPPYPRVPLQRNRRAAWANPVTGPFAVTYGVRGATRMEVAVTDRPDGCYRWVKMSRHPPEIAEWCGDAWVFPGDETAYRRVHKVGVGGTLDAPPDVWEDDLPVVAQSKCAAAMSEMIDTIMRHRQDIRPIYGTDDPDAR